MPAGPIKGTDDDSVDVITVHIVRLDLQPCITAIVHLPWGVQCFDDDAFLLQFTGRAGQLRLIAVNILYSLASKFMT